MAFPGELNINYYRGDTYDFNVYPKKTDGTVFDLTNYGNAKFTLSTARGFSGISSQVEALATVSSDATYLACKIRPADGNQLIGGTQYVYDVQVTNSGTSPSTIYTLLTGTISVTDDVSNTSYVEPVEPTTIPVTTITYHVTYITDFDVSGNVTVDSNEYMKNQTVTLANGSGLSKVGYTFTGWTLNANGTGNVYNPGDQYPVGSSNIIFYAKWTPTSYLVTYNSGGGTSVVNGSFKTDGAIATAPTPPTRTGFAFNGWYATDEKIEKITFPYSPGGSSNITLYGEWDSTITYDGNGHTSGTVPSPTVAKGTNADTILATNSGSLARTGYTFDGWRTLSNITYPAGLTTYASTGSITLYAKWVAA